jgi:hypothetical protein
MAKIQNDQELRGVLDRLDPQQQRRLGALFVDSASDLCDDERVRRAVRLAQDPALDDDVREDAFRSAKEYAVSTYTECGRDTDWNRQAAHFVAVAAACLLAGEEGGAERGRAWRVGMQVRNARNCALIAQEQGADIDEAERQRRIASEFIGAAPEI